MRRSLDSVIAGCDRAAHLVAQLLTLARLEPPRIEVEHADCDLRALAEAAIADTAPFALEHGIDIELAGGSAMVRGDARLLGVLLRNLLDNAVRYSPEASVVHVEVGERERTRFVRVADPGPGVPARERERLGQRFHRLASADIAGTGLGPSIVKRIAQLHDASVAFDEAAGRGLAVTLTFTRR